MTASSHLNCPNHLARDLRRIATFQCCIRCLPCSRKDRIDFAPLCVAVALQETAAAMMVIAARHVVPVTPSSPPDLHASIGAIHFRGRVNVFAIQISVALAGTLIVEAGQCSHAVSNTGRGYARASDDTLPLQPALGGIAGFVPTGTCMYIATSQQAQPGASLRDRALSPPARRRSHATAARLRGCAVTIALTQASKISAAILRRTGMQKVRDEDRKAKKQADLRPVCLFPGVAPS